MTANEMPKTCAWCNRAWFVEGQWTDQKPEADPVSHGVCPECKQREQAKAKLPDRECRVPDDYRMPFGAHRGEKIGDVPASYLIWLESQDWITRHAKVCRYIRENKQQLLQEVDEHANR